MDSWIGPTCLPPWVVNASLVALWILLIPVAIRVGISCYPKPPEKLTTQEREWITGNAMIWPLSATAWIVLIGISVVIAAILWPFIKGGELIERGAFPPRDEGVP